jgi:hypothetical protein
MKLDNILYARRNNLDQVSGFLNPIMWNQSGDAVKFSIYTSEDEDVIISGNYNNTLLRSMLGKLVEAYGILNDDRDDEKTIDLKRISEIKTPHAPAIGSSHKSYEEDFNINLPSSYKFFISNDRIINEKLAS